MRPQYCKRGTGNPLCRNHDCFDTSYVWPGYSCRRKTELNISSSTPDSKSTTTAYKDSCRRIQEATLVGKKQWWSKKAAELLTTQVPSSEQMPPDGASQWHSNEKHHIIQHWPQYTWYKNANNWSTWRAIIGRLLSNRQTANDVVDDDDDDDDDERPKWLRYVFIIIHSKQTGVMAEGLHGRCSEYQCGKNREFVNKANPVANTTEWRITESCWQFQAPGIGDR